MKSCGVVEENMDPEALDMFPPPPPWRREKDDISNEVKYKNDVTGEVSDVHPLQVHFDQKSQEVSNCQSKEHKEISTKDTENTSSNIVCEIESGKVEEEDFCGGEHMDFRCEWKEIGLMGNTLSYGLTLKYYVEDKHFELVFDGVDAVWKYSKLDGIYGPIDEFDLFIGSKLSIFGRHLSISSTNSDICRLIDKKESKLKKKRAYMQEKIETVGSLPCVRRETQDRIRNITRSSSKTGHGNLRRLRNEILKLSEQMGELGLSHLIK